MDNSQSPEQFICDGMDTYIPFLSKYIRGPILDVGCGTGVGGRYLAEKLQYPILQCDIEDLRYEGSKGIDFVLFDGKKLPIADNQFNTAYVQHVLHHVQGDIIPLLSELYRVSTEKLIIVEEISDGYTDLNPFITIDTEVNEMLHPKSSFPVARFLSRNEIIDSVVATGWIPVIEKAYHNKNYLDVVAFIFSKHK